MAWLDENIEEGVRANGFNTICSCHHDMQIVMDVHLDGELQRMHNLLINNGENDYAIQLCVNVRAGRFDGKWITLTLCREPYAKDVSDGQ